jgi:hypothetical protein
VLDAGPEPVEGLSVGYWIFCVPFRRACPPVVVSVQFAIRNPQSKMLITRLSAYPLTGYWLLDKGGGVYNHCKTVQILAEGMQMNYETFFEPSGLPKTLQELS